MKRNKKILLFLYTLALFLILAYPLHTIRRIEFPAEEPVELKFKVRLYDPYDPMRGRYVRLQPVLNRLETKDKKSKFSFRSSRSSKYYLVLEKGADGFARPLRLEDKMPVLKKGEAAVRVKSIWHLNGYGKEKGKRFYNFKLPFDRFYVNEFKAPQLEEELRKKSGKGKHMVLTVRFFKDGLWAVSGLK